MASIQASVGRGGVNIRADVRTVQNLINSHIRLIPPTEPLDPDGKVGTNTINAIKAFQRLVVGMSQPDGRVDPGGQTLAALNDESGRGPRAAATYHYPVGPQEPLIEIARPYIGATEVRGNRMGNFPCADPGCPQRPRRHGAGPARRRRPGRSRLVLPKPHAGGDPQRPCGDRENAAGRPAQGAGLWRSEAPDGVSHRRIVSIPHPAALTRGHPPPQAGEG